MRLIDGTTLAQQINTGLMQRYAAEYVQRGKTLHLGVVVVGEDPATMSFIRQKERTAAAIGIKFSLLRFPENISTTALRKNISTTVHSQRYDAFIVQLPLPSRLNQSYILNAIPARYDADCLSAIRLGKFYTRSLQTLAPPPVQALDLVFRQYTIDVVGKTVVLVGAGLLIGKPLAIFFINQGATVIVVNSRTADLAAYLRKADIIVSGAGQAHMITVGMTKNDAVIIDFGFAQVNGKVVGDVDYESFHRTDCLIAPVPGGMGPLTVSMLFNNILLLHQDNTKTKTII